MKEKIISAIMQIQGFQVFMYLVLAVSAPGAVMRETFDKKELRIYTIVATAPTLTFILFLFLFQSMAVSALFFVWVLILAIMAAAGKRAVEVAMDGDK